MWGKKGMDMLSRGRVCPGSSSLKVLKARSLGEVLGEDLNRIVISFMLMCQHEFYFLNFICPWVLAQIAVIGYLLSLSF